MSDFITSLGDFDPNALYACPLGGQAEIGLTLWLFIHHGQILIVDAGASYPANELPGVDLFLPNSNFLEANEDKIVALILTNGHEEHCGAVSYLLNHVKVPRVMAPRFVATLIKDNVYDLYGLDLKTLPAIEEIETRRDYTVGAFNLEWIDSNNAIADACALKIATTAGTVIYTSSFKYDQTPVDGKLLDVGRLAAIGDAGVDLLISDSVNIEAGGYTPSEKSVAHKFDELARECRGRLIVVAPATNTHRLRLLFEAAQTGGRRVILMGDTLHKIAVAAAMTGHLTLDPKLTAALEEMPKMADRQVMVIASSIEADPISVLEQLAYGEHPSLTLKGGDTVVFSSDVMPGQARHMGYILDQLLERNVKAVWGARQGVHVSKHAAKEELKLILSTVKPSYFIPAIGEGRHITQHGDMALDVGLDQTQIYTLANGDVFELDGFATVRGVIESQPVLFNREQGERVTTASVNERRALSLEGVVTIGLSITAGGEIASGPTLECGASGFLRSSEWLALEAELDGIIREAVRSKNDLARAEGKKSNMELLGITDGLASMRSAIRESVVKTLRSRLSAKPTVQVLLSRAEK
ncbi:MAG: ribonuclease J [Cyanobacteria bacterium SZAS LIN-2]|nr:ribonuclease J [Cyanobacteria bacterium SZAS LIN-2]